MRLFWPCLFYGWVPSLFFLHQQCDGLRFWVGAWLGISDSWVQGNIIVFWVNPACSILQICRVCPLGVASSLCVRRMRPNLMLSIIGFSVRQANFWITYGHADQFWQFKCPFCFWTKWQNSTNLLQPQASSPASKVSCGRWERRSPYIMHTQHKEMISMCSVPFPTTVHHILSLKGCRRLPNACLYICVLFHSSSQNTDLFPSWGFSPSLWRVRLPHTYP